jgi:hypothetical protein
MSRWVIALVMTTGCWGEVQQPTKVEPVPVPAPAPPVQAPAPAAVAPVVPAPAAAKVFFVEPKDGAKVSSPVHVKFGVEGMDVKPAGDATPNTGHHHLIINGSSIEQGQVVPKDETHIHYGKGQLEDDLKLTPGDYTLTLQFADLNHLSYGSQMSSTIHITVQ